MRSGRRVVSANHYGGEKIQEGVHRVRYSKEKTARNQRTPSMLHATALVLFESTDSPAVLSDPANQDWLAVVNAVAGDRYETQARRYYMALYHFRTQQHRSALPATLHIAAQGKQQALQGMLAVMEERKAKSKQGADSATDVFIDASPDKTDTTLPEALRDFSEMPPTLRDILTGPGRPPCDALCLMRAFLAAPLMGVGDDPTRVYKLLHGNPTFARACGFRASGTPKVPGEMTSRALPALSTCEEFTEIMMRYGLWHLARMEQVRHNLDHEVVDKEDTLSFDTTHLIANSHCANVLPLDAKMEDGKKPKYRKVPRMGKNCACGKDHWESCEHPWSPTDPGAAVVVKGTTRIYWAHKVSVVCFGDSEIPVDARALQYAAQADGKTLIPHLELLEQDFCDVVDLLRYVLADDAYRDNKDAVRRFGQQARLIVPVHGRKARADLADALEGINRFTPSGVPVCEGGHRFELRGRDVNNERYIWVAPDDIEGQPVCASCPLAESCLEKGERRYIRVDRQDQPQINWEHPQHFGRQRVRYGKRTGVERAIKRLKVDLRGEYLTHRDAHRVQAHLDRKLLTLHLLLAAANSS